MNTYEEELEKIYRKEKVSSDDLRRVYQLINASGGKSAMFYYYAAMLLQPTDPGRAKELAQKALEYRNDFNGLGMERYRARLTAMAGEVPHTAPRPAPRAVLKPADGN